jgi:chromosomal replication initiation ATPase DnaA
MTIESEYIWSECLTTIKTRINPRTYEEWFQDTLGLDIINDQFFLGVPSHETAYWLASHYASVIENVLTQQLGRPISLEFQVLEPV